MKFFEYFNDNIAQQSIIKRGIRSQDLIIIVSGLQMLGHPLTFAINKIIEFIYSQSVLAIAMLSYVVFDSFHYITLSQLTIRNKVQIFLKEFQILLPEVRVYLVRVSSLLMVETDIRKIDDFIDHCFAVVVTDLPLFLFFFYLDLFLSVFFFLHIVLKFFFYYLQHLLFFVFGIYHVYFIFLFVFFIPQSPIFGDDLVALESPPNLVFDLLFLF